MNRDHPCRPQRGVAIVEFALMLPALLIMTFLVAEVGRAIYEYNTLTKTVRDAARYLSIQTPNTHQAQARNLILYGTPELDGQQTPPAPLVRELAATQIPDAVWEETVGTDPVIRTVTVRVTGYTYRPIFGNVFGVAFGPITFADITATMRSHL